MTVTVVAAVSLAALLGISGLLLIGHKISRGIQNSRFPLLVIPASLPFIILNLALALYFSGMARDAGAGGVDSISRAGMYIWALPAAASALSVLWFLVIVFRTIIRRK